jgi:hypothetical protein
LGSYPGSRADAEIKALAVKTVAEVGKRTSGVLRG